MICFYQMGQAFENRCRSNSMSNSGLHIDFEPAQRVYIDLVITMYVQKYANNMHKSFKILQFVITILLLYFPPFYFLKKEILHEILNKLQKKKKLDGKNAFLNIENYEICKNISESYQYQH